MKPILEVGSNVFELIEFTVTRNGRVLPSSVTLPGNEAGKAPLFGVNVAKVREVIRLPHIVPCLTSCPEVLGVFNLRGMPIPAIHLASALGFTDEPVLPTSQIIVTEFSKRLAGFIVSGTRRIRRISWDKVLPPSSEAFSTITGMVFLENQEFLFILDFEQILADIEGKSKNSVNVSVDGWTQNPTLDARKESGTALTVKSAETSRKAVVMVVDDSPTMRKAICEMLRGRNLDILECSNGEQAWGALNDERLMAGSGGIDIIISDVEMPRMDGYSLVKRVKAHATLKKVPIILHSSLTGEVNRDRAKAVGADAYVTKFNKREILDVLADLLAHSQNKMGESA